MSHLPLDEIEKLAAKHKDNANIRDFYVSEAWRNAIKKHLIAKDGQLPDYSKLPDKIDDIIADMKADLQKGYKEAVGVDHSNSKDKLHSDMVISQYFGLNYDEMKEQIIDAKGTYSNRDFTKMYTESHQKLMQQDVALAAQNLDIKTHYNDFQNKYLDNLLDDLSVDGKKYTINKDLLTQRDFQQLMMYKTLGGLNADYLRTQKFVQYK